MTMDETAACAPRRFGRAARVLATTRLLLWRVRCEQARGLLLAPLGVIAMIALAGFASAAFPQVLTGMTAGALRRGATEVLHVTPAGTGLLEAFVVLQAPYLLATFTGFVAASFARSLVFADVARGAMEVWLASGTEIVELALAYLAALAVLTLSTLGCSLVALLALAALPGSGIDPFALLRTAHGGDLLLMLLCVAVVSVEIAMATCLLFPRLSGAHSALTFSPLQLLAALPGLALTLLVSAEPGATRWLPLFTLVAIVAGAALYALLLRRLFDPRLYLAS
jgi:hypothetical protein